MIKISKLSLMASMLILAGGMWQLVNAQDMESTAPAPSPRARTYVISETAGPSSPSREVTAGEDWSPESALEVRGQQGIQYLSGGVTKEERLEFNGLTQQFNLRLLFALRGSGDYLAAVQVNILDAHGGSVLNVESEGPWFFAQLPPGDYTVEVTAPVPVNQQSQRKKVHILNSRQSQLKFYW